MSGYLAGEVWQSNLSPHLKPLAAALADIGNDDGSSIYPSVAYLSWLMGRSRRAIQTGLAELRLAGLLEIIREGGEGPGDTREYRLIRDNLPARAPWKTKFKKGATAAPLRRRRKGAYGDTEGRSLEHRRAQPTAPNPSLQQPVEEPSPPTPHGGLHGFDRFWQAYPRKIGKGACQRLWLRLRPDAALVERMLAAVDQQKRSEQWGKDHGQFIPLPATWLSQTRWEDEPYKGLWPREK